MEVKQGCKVFAALARHCKLPYAIAYPITSYAWGRAQAATAYTKEQREGLLAAREALFRRMHQILEQRERLVATLQAGFPSTDTEHANAPLYVAVWRPGARH